MNAAPPEFSRIPLVTLKAKTLATLERLYFKQLRLLDPLRKTVPEVAMEYDRANRCWSSLYREAKRRRLAAALREPVLWTVFVPDSIGLREVIRTKRHTITYWWHNEYPLFAPAYKARGQGDATEAWKLDDPWKEFARLQKSVATPSATSVELAA